MCTFKHVLIISIIMLFASQGNADAQFGIKAGLTVSNFYYTGQPSPYNDYDIDLRPYLGYDVELVQTGSQTALLSPYISVYRTFHLASRLGFRPELSFTNKGVQFNQYDYERNLYKVRISYLELPLSITCQYLRKENSSGELFAGVFGAYRLGAVKKVSTYEGSYTQQVSSVKSFEGGMHAGINFKRILFDHFLLFDLRLFIGLTDIFTLPENWTAIYYETQTTKITGFNFSVGYEF